VWVLAATAVVVPLSAAAQDALPLLERRARLDVEDVPLADALTALQRTSGVPLAFSPDLLPAAADRTCRCTDVTVRVALEQLLSGTGLRYVEGRRQVLVGRSEGNGDAARANTLVGVVVEEGGGRPVPSAEVRLEDAARSALTGDDGRFVLPGVAPGGHRVNVAALGYEGRSVEVEVPGADGRGLRVELTRAPIPLAEIVIAPGSFGVLEVSPAVSGVRVSREDIEATPQLGDDVFRTLKRMPGVSTDDISTRLNVRGSTDRDLLVRLDGLELYEPYHLRDLDGALGIVDVQALGGVDLITGGFPVEYGDKSAGVFDMRSRRPPTTGTRTTLGLSLSSVGMNSQGNFRDGRGQWLASLRRGFLEYVLAVGGVEDDINPRYWDALGRVQYLVDEGHVVSAEVLVAGDAMTWRDEETGSRVDSDWSSGYAWLTWDATLGRRVRAQTLLSAGALDRDRRGSISGGRGEFTPLGSAVSDVATFGFLGVKQDWQVDLGADLLLKAGVDFRSNSAEYDYASASTRYDIDGRNQLYVRGDSTSVSTDPSGDEVGSYVALRGRVGRRVTWEGGARYDRAAHTGDDDLAPRLLLRWDAGDDTSVRGSWGRYFQSQGLSGLNVQDGQSTFQRAERSEQVALGVERRLGGGLTARVEAYTRSIRDPQPVFVNLSREVNPIPEVESDRRRIAPDEARTKGLEFIVSRDAVGAFSWAGSYALAKAEDRIAGVWVPRTLDQRHTVNLQGAWRFTGAWQLSGSWQYHTGWPFTEQELDLVLLPGDQGQQVEVRTRGFGPYNARRLPAYHRLDLRLTRGFDFRRSRLELYLDVFNAYNRTNLRGYEWYLVGDGHGGFSAARDSGEEQLPILPTLGFRWVF